MLLFWLFGLYAAESAINLRNCVYLCVLWPYATSPARGDKFHWGSGVTCHMFSSRPPSQNMSRPGSSATKRSPSRLSVRSASRASVRPQSRFSERTHSRHARSRLIPPCQTLVSQFTGLRDEGSELDPDGENFREAFEHMV